MDVDQFVNARQVLSSHMSEVGSLGLQKLVVAVAVGFSHVPSPLLLLLLVMVVVVLIVPIIQE